MYGTLFYSIENYALAMGNAGLPAPELLRVSLRTEALYMSRLKLY
jgi:hypothetical protein